MAGFQQSLKDVTAPTAANTSGSVSIPRVSSGVETAAYGLTALAGIADKGLQIFDKLDKQEGLEEFNKRMVSLVDAKQQGAIGSSEFTTKINQAFITASKKRPEMTQTFTAAMKETIGTVPFAVEISGEVQQNEGWRQGGALLDPNASPEQQIEIGRQAALNAKKAEQAKAALDASIAKKGAQVQEQKNNALSLVGAITDQYSFTAITRQASTVGASAETLDEKRRFADTFSGWTDLTNQARMDLREQLKGAPEEVYDAAMKRFDDYVEDGNTIFDPEKGPLNLKSYSLFYKAAQDQLGMDAMQTTRTVSMLKEVLGPQALGNLIQQSIAESGSKQTAIFDAIGNELNSLMTTGRGDENVIRLQHLIDFTKRGDAAAVIASQGEVRTSKLAQMGLELKRGFDNGTGTVNEQNAPSFANTSLNLSTLAIDNLNRAVNMNEVMKAFDHTGHRRNMEVLKGYDPQLAEAVGTNIATSSQASVLKIMKDLGDSRASKGVVYNPVSKQFEDTELKFGSERGPARDRLVSKVKDNVEYLNRSLKVLADHAKYDPVLAKLSNNGAVKDYAVYMAQQATGLDFLNGGKLELPTLQGESPAMVEASRVIPSRSGKFNRSLNTLQERIAAEREESTSRELKGKRVEQVAKRVLSWQGN